MNGGRHRFIGSPAWASGLLGEPLRIDFAVREASPPEAFGQRMALEATGEIGGLTCHTSCSYN